MTIWLQLLLLGVGAGAVYALFAVGLVITWQGAGVINFAHGAIAMFGGFVYRTAAVDGDLLLPMVGLPHRVSLGDSVAPWIAVALAVIVCALIGAIVDIVVFARLHHAPQLARIVASVGLLLVLQGIVFVHFGSGTVSAPANLPVGAIDLGVSTLIMPKDRMWIAAITVAVALMMVAVSRFTRWGLVTRAAESNRDAAQLLGYSPVAIARSNWVLAGAVAGLVGALAAPITSLNTTNFILFVVPGLACALLARFRSYSLAAVAGLCLGMFESVAPRIAGQSWWPEQLPASALQKGLPLLLIIAAVLRAGDVLPERGSRTGARHLVAPAPRSPVTLLAVAVLAAVGLFVFEDALRLALIVTIITAVLLVSLVMLTGWLGQLSLAPAVAAGAAGFATARLMESGLGFPFAQLAGGVAAAALGLVIGLPSLRVRGPQLAIVTMATGVLLEEALFRNAAVTGASGARLVPQPTLFGLDLAASRGEDFNRWQFGLTALIVTIGVCTGAYLIRTGSFGRTCLAVRSNERAAAAAGINVVTTKVVMFALSSFFVGIGGAMLAHLRGAISVVSFSVFVSLVLVAFAYLGGITSISGAILGACLAPGGLAFGAIEHLGGGDPGKNAVLIGGVGLIAVVLLAPHGVDGRIPRRARGATSSPTQ